ncbi:DUF7511 domain-containing protein [Natronorubrum halophilum]|uniref:DUF7511 domain-containing protein n=1 Tax=Natronorubrum halophilum TaxID=1702106 RepID=UPI000EF664FB|nr:hypothetical protein [Natronorubrum halophilum]
MSKSSHDSDGHAVRRRLEAAATDADPSSALECVVVHYRNQSDRCTIAPRECPEEERTTTWLSADLSAVVDLAAVR